MFGMINSYTAGGDDVTVRSFNHSVFGVDVVAQEDQCDKQSVIHIQSEKISFLAIGLSNGQRSAFSLSSQSAGICGTSVDTKPPKTPSAAPKMGNKNPTRRPTALPSPKPTHKPTPGTLTCPTNLHICMYS